ncbi:MAG: RHS repeat-associated core domain-containing protein [Candidatus Omnitrophica bacterium]|nr:RHS repeat-associated core domain-containing protein [Candidatus Omnitrophota bacterium]
MDTPDDTPIACSAFGNPFLFTGREYDCESGLIYMRARYYDPHTGTFLQEDPLGFFVSANAYPYVTNNPVNLTDPLGLLPRKLGPFPNPAWSETRDRVKQEFSTRFGDRFSDEELNFAAEKFADEVRLKELNRLRDPHTQGETLKDIGQRIKDEVERTGSPQEKDIVKRLEEAIMEEAKRQQERAQCQLDRSPPTELLW